MPKGKSWALTFVLATGTFWLILTEDPPKSVAADPITVFSPLQIQIPADLPSSEGGNAF